jgi:uncharacterized protein YihD (DUF1040 family)
MTDISRNTKVQVQGHLKTKTTEELQKGYEALYESYLRGKTKLQLVEMVMDHTKETGKFSDRQELIDEIVRIQLAMMFGEE